MPFGVANPFSHKAKGVIVTHLENYDHCPVCEKPLGIVEGRVPVALCVLTRSTHEIENDLPARGFYGCSACYQAQKRLKYSTMEELVDYRRSKGQVPGRKKGVQRSKTTHKNMNRVATTMTTDLNDLKSVYESLGVIYRALGRLVAGQGDVPGSPEQPSEAPVYESPDDEDDILAGMTDEQRARMDEAVAMASARTLEVPQEVPRDW